MLSSARVASIWSELLNKPVHYAGHDMERFETQMRERAPAWSAFDIRTVFQRYIEQGFAAEPSDVQTLTALLGHPPRRYEDFAREAARKWQSRCVD